MIERRIKQQVTDALDRQAAVALIGPRQVGKTTLAQEIGEERKALYLDLEDSSDREKLSNAALFLKQYEDRLVVLDEIHRAPELFQTLRGLIDQGRRKGRRTGRFLILGSASIDLLRQSGESLAGRIEYVDMQPLDVIEVGTEQDALNRLWIRGGFPDSFLARNEVDSLKLRKSFVRTYLERDVPQFGPRIPAETLERLWTMLAHGQGTLLNASRLASGLSLSAPTVTNYIDLLVDLLLVRRLRPIPVASDSREYRQASGEVAKSIRSGQRLVTCTAGDRGLQQPRRASGCRDELGGFCDRKSSRGCTRQNAGRFLPYVRRCGS